MLGHCPTRASSIGAESTSFASLSASRATPSNVAAIRWSRCSPCLVQPGEQVLHHLAVRLREVVTSGLSGRVRRSDLVGPADVHQVVGVHHDSGRSWDAMPQRGPKLVDLERALCVAPIEDRQVDIWPFFGGLDEGLGLQVGPLDDVVRPDEVRDRFPSDWCATAVSGLRR